MTDTASNFFALRNAAEPRIAPDGSFIIATIIRRDPATDTRIPSLWRTEDRATWTELPDTDGVVTARSAPTGSRIALIRRMGRAMRVEIHDGDTITIIAHSATPLRELAWSPDGARLAVQQRIDAPLPAWLGLGVPPEGARWSDLPRHTNRLLYRHDAIGELPESIFQIFIAVADASAPPRQLTHGSWHNGFPHYTHPGLIFSADGSEVLIAGTQREDWDTKPSHKDIHAIDVETGAVRRLTDIPGPTAHGVPSPDGKHLAFTAVQERGLSHHLRRLYVMPIEGGPMREILPDLDRSIGEIGWTADSNALFVTYEDYGNGVIARTTLDGQLAVLATDASAGAIEMPYGGNGFSAAADGTLVYLRSASDLPCEVAIIASGDKPATITRLNPEAGPFRPAETFWVDGGEGRRVQCWLILPAGQGPHPLVLEIHGGPYAQYGDRFSFKYQSLAAAGYAVLFTNPTGSTGYGEAFTTALHDRFPGPDFDDLMAAVDVTAARPDIDSKELFISGVSGGGVLTLWSVTHTHRFRAAVAIKPVVDWQSWVLGADIGPSIGLRWMGDSLPWEAPEKYRARSPLTYAQDARTPTLLMAGETDSRTPISETFQMYAALKLAGVEAELLRFPGTSHSSGTMRPSLFAAEVSAIIGWFDRHRLRS